MSEENSKYICSQCGPAPEGPVAHQLSHHTLEPLCPSALTALERIIETCRLETARNSQAMAGHARHIESLESDLEQLRKQVHAANEKLEFVGEKAADAHCRIGELCRANQEGRPVTMPNPLPGQTMSDEQVWLSAFCASQSCSNNESWPWDDADKCLADFKARFRKE